MKTVGNCVKEFIKAQVIGVRITWVSNIIVECFNASRQVDLNNNPTAATSIWLLRFAFILSAGLVRQVSLESIFDNKATWDFILQFRKDENNCKTVELHRLVVNRFHSSKPKERLFNGDCSWWTRVFRLVAASQDNTRISYLQALVVTKCKLFYHYLYLVTCKTLTKIEGTISVFLSSFRKLY